MEEIQAEGLKWIKRKERKVPYWVAAEEDVKNGYTPKTVNLDMFRDQRTVLVAKCNVLQAEMLLWRTGYRSEENRFDGTVKSLLKIYQRHPESDYHTLKPSTRVPYSHYLRSLDGHIGNKRIDAINGIDIKRWHKTWSSDGKHLAAATMARSVLLAALSFGVQLKIDGAHELAIVIRETSKKLPSPQPRTASMKASEIIAARKAAHANGSPSRALAYALAFETTLRLWDVIGQWWPINEGGISDVIDAKSGRKWFGLKWENISPDLVLSYTPSKTDDTTAKSISYPLSQAPMVLEEMENWPVEKRTGPVIVSEHSGKPYLVKTFRNNWIVDRKAAGISSKVWARDLRASGITEGRASDVSTDDIRRVAGHASAKMTEEVYDRTTIEAAERFAKKRLEHRETKR